MKETTINRSTLFVVIDMITSRLSDIKEEQKDPETAYSENELFAVKIELRDVLKKLWAEVNKIDEASTKVIGNIEKNFLEEEIREIENEEDYHYGDWGI